MGCPGLRALAVMTVLAGGALAGGSGEARAAAAAPEAGAAQGLSFRLVDDAANSGVHAGETQARFKNETLWLEAEVPISGRMIAEARPFLDGPDHRPAVAFRLTSEGAARFAAFTRGNVGRRLAILVNGEVIAAPVIQSEMAEGAGAISGDFTAREASLLAMQINDAAEER